MMFNGDKFQLVRYGKNEDLQNEIAYRDPGNNIIHESSSAKDLGVIMSANCKFGDHIEQMVQKASNMCGWILRSFFTREKQAMLTLFKSLILGRLDYCYPIWNLNGSVALTTRIESVHRAFTRKIS